MSSNNLFRAILETRMRDRRVQRRDLKLVNDFDSAADVVYYHGDCRELLQQVPRNFFQLIVTSPPYNIGKEYENKLDLDTYIKQQGEIIDLCVDKLKEGGSICWQVGNHVNGEIVPLDIILYPLFKKHGLKLRNRIMWHFGHGLHATKRFSGRYETILWFTKGDDYYFNVDPVRVPPKYPAKKYFRGAKKGQYSCNPMGKNPSDVWEIPNVKANHVEKTEHPAQFPVELIERLVLSMTKEGDWVCDPFMGVASTAVAAILHNRKAAGAEKVAKYVTIGKKRLQLAAEGKLETRPMGKPVYEPDWEQPEMLKGMKYLLSKSGQPLEGGLEMFLESK